MIESEDMYAKGKSVVSEKRLVAERNVTETMGFMYDMSKVRYPHAEQKTVAELEGYQDKAGPPYQNPGESIC